MTRSTSDRLAEVHERARSRFEAIWSTVRDERKECLEDRRFCTIRGAQWENGDLAEQFANAPKMEVNKTHKEVIRIFSRYRANRITVDFRPKDDADPETADALDGLYRADEEESGAQEAYDTGFDEGVTGGMGSWRLRAAYEDEEDPENEYQRIRFEALPDADQRVFFDLGAKRQDKADARFCFVLNPLSPDAYKDEYNDDPETWPAPESGSFDWYGPEIVYVAEYYEIEEQKSLKRTFTHILVDDEKSLIDPTDEEVADLEAQGWTESRQRKIKRQRVHKYILNGARVIEDEGLIAGKHIPIIPVYGKRWYIENIERCMGHVRLQKDPQRIYNAEVSSLVETAGLAQHERPIFTPEQVRGHEQTWADGNIKRLPYQLINPLMDNDGNPVLTAAIGKVEAPNPSPALAALIQIAGADIAELSGANDQTDTVPANTSAQAIDIVTTRSDEKNFIYEDNFAKAVKRCGEIWLAMAHDLYIEQGRKMRTIGNRGETDMITLGQEAIDASGAQFARNDFAAGKFDVVVDVGPASTTRRDATVRALAGMAQVAGASDPELANVLLSTALVNMDGEGIDDVQKWVRGRLVRNGVLKPTDDEKAAMEQEAQNQQPDPNSTLALAAADQAKAEADKARAGTIKTLADTELVKAKTASELSGAQRNERQQVLDVIGSHMDRLVEREKNLGNGAVQ
jgi:hypothetical protein